MGEHDGSALSEHERVTGIIAAQREIIRLDVDVEAMLRTVVERAMQLTGATGSVVTMGDGDAMVCRVAAGLLRAFAGVHVPRESSMTARCMLRNEVFVCADADGDARVDREACRRAGVRSIIAVPLVHGGAGVGALEVVHTAPGAFTQRDVDTLEVMGALVSGVLSRTSAIGDRELKFDAFMRNSPMGAFLKDREGRFVFVNQAYERLAGRPRAEILGRTSADLYPPDVAARMAARDQKALESGPVESIDDLGVSQTCLSVVFPVADVSGASAVGGLMMDVSLRRASEDALRASEHRFRSLAEYASDAVISVDAAGRIVFWNHTAVRVFGYEPDEAMGRSLSAMLEDRATARPLMDIFAARGNAQQASPVELRARRKSSSEFPVEVSVSTWSSGDEQFFTAIVRDVTERKIIQEQLSHATRLISIGTLASGISHEINNPLSYVMYNLEFASETIEAILAEANDGHGVSPESLQKLVPVRDDLLEAANGADRIRAILRDLRTFSRAGDERKLPTSLSRAADAAINMVFNQIRHHARVVKDYRDTPLVDAVEGKLVQVIVNLLVNAAQATSPGRPEDNVIGVRTLMVDRSVVLEVTDTGSGIAPANLQRIFEPFYTTKAVGSGTGLGLSISHGIVESFGGTIEVESVVGEGSTFRVKLPPSQPSRRGGSLAPRATSMPVRRARVMVIDDEPQVSASLQRMLAREHDVVAYTSSLAAARELATGAPYDLILCDLMMPDLPGWQLYKDLTVEQKGRVAFMTGGAFQPSARAFLADIKNPVLDKPIDARQLRALLRERLAG